MTQAQLAVNAEEILQLVVFLSRTDIGYLRAEISAVAG